MLIQSGEIIIKKHANFLDGGLDINLKGRPFISINEVETIESEIHCVMLTRKKPKGEKSILVMKDKYNGMKHNSYARFGKIYVFHINQIAFPIRRKKVSNEVAFEIADVYRETLTK